jgi:putative transcriptional regulator
MVCMNNVSLTNHFLIAMPQLDDPNFFHSVTYICQHNHEGAMGIIINQPLDNMKLGDILSHLEIDHDDPAIAQQQVYFGGPVQPERGFILHRPGRNWQGTLFVSDDIALTSSSDILDDIARHEGPSESLVALGYASWGAGQLEAELGQNAWLSVPASADIIFKTPVEQRWSAAATLLGIDLQLLSEDVGHA